jgi:LPS export ABC transporter protein LptC
MTWFVRGTAWLAGVAFAVTFVGCSLDLSTATAVNPDDVPLLVMEDFVQTTVQNGRELYSITGKRAENYNARQEVRLKDFTFQEYDADGKVVSQGQADSATIRTNTNDAYVDGTLTAQSSKQGVMLTVRGGEGGGVDWANAEKVITTRAGSQVLVEKADGSRIRADALVLNLKTNELVLDRAVTGLWKVDTTQNDSPPPLARLPSVLP